MLCMIEFNKYKYTRCPKNFLTECCWSDCAPGLKNVFCLFWFYEIFRIFGSFFRFDQSSGPMRYRYKWKMIITRMPSATAVNWNVIYWIFQCKYQFEYLSSLKTIYVIFILCCTIFHFLLFLDSLCLCLCLLFSHVQCCNHSDKLWERLKVSWTTLLCSEDLEMEKLVTDSSATSALSSNTPLPTSSSALVNPLSLPLQVILCLQTAV